MSAYPPPQEFNPVFNESEYNTSSDSLTQASGDLRYLKLTGGVLSGITTFSAGLQTANIYNAGNTFSVPGSSGQLALVSQIPSSAGFVDTTTNQSINGIKTFSTNPIISAISNSGFNLSIPTITGADTIASLGLAQTLTNKTLNLVAGAFGTPSLYFSTDTTSGLYRPAANQIGISCSGALRGIWSSTGLAITGGISTTTTINAAAGTVGTPSLFFSTDTTSGFYRPAADQVGISCNGSQVGNFTTSGLTITGSISASTTALTGAGSVGTPAIQMGGDTTSGFYRSGANEVAISTSGIQRGKWSSTGLAITGISQTSIPMSTMMTKSTAQSTANGSAVSVVSYNVSSNPSSYFTLNTTLGTITFTVSDAPCMILVSGQIQFPTNAFTFIREIWIEDNSGLRWVDANRNGSNDTGDTSKSSIAGMRMITTNATYTLIMKIYQNTGGTINSGGIVSTNLTTFCCARIN